MNATRVTMLSLFCDKVWDYRNEYHVPSVPVCSRRIVFDGVWERTPEMCAVVKSYLWGRLNGQFGRKKIGWGFAQSLSQMFTLIAERAEAHGFARWCDVTNIDWRLIYATVPMKRKTWQAFYELERLSAAGIQNGPIANPLLGVPRRKHAAVRQTEIIPAAVMEQLVTACLKMESNVMVLRKMVAEVETRKIWDGTVLGIRNRRELYRWVSDTQSAGIILLLIATGMRVSELLSIPRNGLKCNQKTGEWFVQGTVFKFHAKGKRAQWICGDLGRRAFAMIDFGFGHTVCTRHNGGEHSASELGRRLKQWMEARNIRDGDNIAEIHPHQFRRTYAVNMMSHVGFNLSMLKEHFKHKSIKMTDYYVGCGQELYDAIAPHHMQMGDFENYLRNLGATENEMYSQTERIL